MEADLRRLRVGHTENIQWGLINMGGYTNFNGFTPMQRQQMHGLERANLIAVRTMGMQRHLNVVRIQNQGIVHGGDDTDMEEHAQETVGRVTVQLNQMTLQSSARSS